MFQLSEESNTNFILFANNLALYTSSNISNFYSMLPPTINTCSDSINAISNIPNLNIYSFCNYNFFNILLNENVENWSLFPLYQVTNKLILFELVYIANKTFYYNLDNLYTGWNLKYEITSQELGNNTIEILNYQSTNITVNQLPSDLIFSYTYGLGSGYFALIVENINNTINFYNCSSTTDNDFNCQGKLTLVYYMKTIGQASMGPLTGNQTAYVALAFQNSNQILILNFFDLSDNSYPINLSAQAMDVLLIGNFLFAVVPSTFEISIFLLSNTTSYLLYNLTT